MLDVLTEDEKAFQLRMEKLCAGASHPDCERRSEPHEREECECGYCAQCQECECDSCQNHEHCACGYCEACHNDCACEGCPTCERCRVVRHGGGCICDSRQTTLLNTTGATTTSLTFQPF